MRPSYAKELLHQALLTLLRKKPLEKVTVSELCKKAGVNRTTFYNYYTAPSDILREIVQQFVTSLPLADDSTALETITHVLSLMESNLSLSRLLLQALPGTFLSDTILALPQIDVLLTNEISPCKDVQKKEAMRAFVSAGSSRLISEWLLSDTRCSAKDESELILSLCRKLYI